MARDPGLLSDLPAGNRAYFCTGGVMALDGVLAQASEMPAEDFAEQYLFGPLGITDYRWSRSGRIVID